jgi:hypothetical protein
MSVNIEEALTEDAVRTVSSALGDLNRAYRLYLTDVGFHTAVNCMVRAGWWPHSLDAETRQRQRKEDEAQRWPSG